MPPSSPADRLKWLRFEAGDEESHELFAPGADWRKQDQYPVVEPLDSYTRDDYLRLDASEHAGRPAADLHVRHLVAFGQ